MNSVFGTIKVKVLNSCRGPKEMNPIYPLGILVTSGFLSQSMLKGRPCSDCRSPWWKNSSNSKSTHTWPTLKSRAKKDKSEECTHKSSASCWFSKQSSKRFPFEICSLTIFIPTICYSMSVAIITPNILRLTSFWFFSLSCARKFVSCIAFRVSAAW